MTNIQHLPPQVKANGPTNSKILIVLSYPSSDDVSAGHLFSGSVGKEADKILHDAGILRTECYITAIGRRRPPSAGIEGWFSTYTKDIQLPGEQLRQYIEDFWAEVDAVKPNVIIPLGDLACWAVTGNKSVDSWRGSILPVSTPAGHLCKAVPTYSFSDVFRQWSWRYIVVMDLRRARLESSSPQYNAPPYDFLVRPSYLQALERLAELAHVGGTVACDIETRNGHIACVGFATSKHRAFCIPLMCVENDAGYWSLEEEIELVWQMCELFRNPSIKWVFQNGIYDLQYFARHWGTVPSVHLDTMLVHHVCFAGLPKGLDFLSSMYCDFHQYWKSEGKLWDPRRMDEDKLWIYNCKDAVITFEVAEALTRTVEQLRLTSPAAFQMRQFPAVLRMMLRGVRQDKRLKSELNMELLSAELERQSFLEETIGYALNPKSPKQMQQFFYTELNLPIQRNRKTGKPTCDDTALQKLASREPIIRPIIESITELRSLGVFRSTFINMSLDHDGRVRCSYNIAGTETYRYSSSEDAFGLGGNLQNIPKGDEAAHLPNVRKLFIPDPGCTIIDCDLDRADAQVVAWEADDAELKQMFREGADIHLENARTIFNNPRLTADSPQRKLAKAGVHATNYGASPPTLARALGISIREAEVFQHRWFSAHRGIKEWHRRVEHSLVTTRSVENRFGFRRYYFDRIESILPEALAWIPQSTVALVIDHGLVNITERLPQVEVLLQVHDSLVMQCETRYLERLLPQIREHLLIPIPYPDPLTISVGCMTSSISWGHCKATPWPNHKERVA